MIKNIDKWTAKMKEFTSRRFPTFILEAFLCGENVQDMTWVSHVCFSRHTKGLSFIGEKIEKSQEEPFPLFLHSEIFQFLSRSFS